MTVDHQEKLLFVGECKYHNKSMDSTIYDALEEKIQKSAVLQPSHPRGSYHEDD